MKNTGKIYDAIIIGSGMGGLTTAALLAKDGLSVLLLEASHVTGGCSSSYKRKGFIFESGATTLTGFDENQPLATLETLTGIHIPRVRLDPGMTVWMDSEPLFRYENHDRWVDEAIRYFGEPVAQRRFWGLAKKVSDTVWKASKNNPMFPPKSLSDWASLAVNNNPLDALVLPYAGKTTTKIAKDCGVTNPEFFRFMNEQLIITAQSTSDDTPFLFAAPALCYTNYANYYVPGGLITMAKAVEDYIIANGGVVMTHRKVTKIHKRDDDWFEVETAKGDHFSARQVISNIPVWNMPDITSGSTQSDFAALSKEYDKAWGAFTMSIATTDTYPDDLTLHHQIHVNSPTGLIHTGSHSIFVSFSQRGDLDRAPDGTRVMNISCHADPDYWFNLNGDYDTARDAVQKSILSLMTEKLPGFKDAEVLEAFPATPVTWEKWIHRSKGRVGGLPQSMSMSISDWPHAETKTPGLWLCGDTVYPGQGIPGVTLSGINVYLRIKRYMHRNRRIFV